MLLHGFHLRIEARKCHPAFSTSSSVVMRKQPSRYQQNFGDRQVDAVGFQQTLNRVPVAQPQLMNVNIFVQATVPSSSLLSDVKIQASSISDAINIRSSLIK